MASRQTFTRDRFTWQIYLLTAFFAYFVNIFGPITPFLRSELRLNYTQASLHFSAYALGLILVGLVAERVISRVGRERSLWLGACGQALGALGLAAGQHPAVTIAACGWIGAWGSLLLAVVPSMLSERYGEQRALALAETNAAGSVTGILAPVAVGILARTALGWRTSLYFGMAALLALFLIFRPSMKGKSKQVESRREEAKHKRAALPLVYWLLWVLLVLADAIEFCIIYWGADYLITVSRLARADAALALSAFLLSMLIGRVAGSRLLYIYSTQQLLPASLLVTLVGFGLFWLFPQPFTAIAGLLISGLGVANLYPLSITLAMGASNGNPDLASARASLASGLGILTLPLLLGRLADGFGIWWAYVVVPLLVFASFGLFFAARQQAHSTAQAQKA